MPISQQRFGLTGLRREAYQPLMLKAPVLGNRQAPVQKRTVTREPATANVLPSAVAPSNVLQPLGIAPGREAPQPVQQKEDPILYAEIAKEINAKAPNMSLDNVRLRLKAGGMQDRDIEQVVSVIDTTRRDSPQQDAVPVEGLTADMIDPANPLVGEYEPYVKTIKQYGEPLYRYATPNAINPDTMSGGTEPLIDAGTGKVATDAGAGAAATGGAETASAGALGYMSALGPVIAATKGPVVGAIEKNYGEDAGMAARVSASVGEGASMGSSYGPIGTAVGAGAGLDKGMYEGVSGNPYWSKEGMQDLATSIPLGLTSSNTAALNKYVLKDDPKDIDRMHRFGENIQSGGLQEVYLGLSGGGRNHPDSLTKKAFGGGSNKKAPPPKWVDQRVMRGFPTDDPDSTALLEYYTQAPGTEPNKNIQDALKDSPESLAFYNNMFNYEPYLKANPDVAEGEYKDKPFQHFLDFGIKEASKGNENRMWRDPFEGKTSDQLYAEQNPDVAQSEMYGKDPYGHYNKYGQKEGRLWPTADVKDAFAPETMLSPEDQYLKDNPDVAAHAYYGKNPEAHYLALGKNEGRTWTGKATDEKANGYENTDKGWFDSP